MHKVVQKVQAICVVLGIFLAGPVKSEETVTVAVASLLGTKALEIEPVMDSNGKMRVNVAEVPEWHIDQYATRAALAAIQNNNGYMASSDNAVSDVLQGHRLLTKWSRGLFINEYVPEEEVRRINEKLGSVDASLLLIIAPDFGEHESADDNDDNSHYMVGYGMAYYPAHLNVFVNFNICVVSLDDLSSKGCGNTTNEQKIILRRALSQNERNEVLEYIQLDLNDRAGMPPFNLLQGESQLSEAGRKNIIQAYADGLTKFGMDKSGVNDRVGYLKELLSPSKISFGDHKEWSIQNKSAVEESIKKLLESEIENEVFNALVRVGANE